MAAFGHTSNYLKSPPVLRPRDLKEVSEREKDAERRECNRGIAEKEFRRNVARWAQWGLEGVCVAQGVYAWQRFMGIGGDDTFGMLSLPALAQYLAPYGDGAMTLALIGMATAAGGLLHLIGVSTRAAIVLAIGAALAVRFGVEISLDMALVTVVNVGIILLTSSLAAELGRFAWDEAAQIAAALACVLVVAFGMAYSIGSSTLHLGMVAQGAVEAGDNEHDRVKAAGEVIAERRAQLRDAELALGDAAMALRQARGEWESYRNDAAQMSQADRAWVMRPAATKPYQDAIAAAADRVAKRQTAVDAAREALAGAIDEKARVAVAVNPAKAILEGAAGLFGIPVERFNLAMGVTVAVLMEMLRIAAAALLNAPLRHSLAWMRDQQELDNLRAAEAELEMQEYEDAMAAPERAKRRVEIAAAKARAEAAEEWGDLRASEIGGDMEEDRADVDRALDIPPAKGAKLRVVESGDDAADDDDGDGDEMRGLKLEDLTPLKQRRVQVAMNNVKRGSRPEALTAKALREWGELYGADERRVFCEWLVERGMAIAPKRKGEGFAWKGAAA